MNFAWVSTSGVPITPIVRSVSCQGGTPHATKKWRDAASRHFFIACGVPPWHETERTTGIIGTPLVDTHAKFIKTASYGDVLQIHTSIAEWRGKSFVQHYRVTRDEDVIMECDEVRIFAARRDDGSIRALPIPQEIRKLCE